MNLVRPKTAFTLTRPSQLRVEYEKPSLSAHRPETSEGSWKCPLDDPELGVISTNDHLTRKCLCKYCSCGRHKCPGEPFLDPYPKSMYATQYNSRFQQSQFVKPIRPVLPYHRQNIHNMEFLTQYEKDYRPFRVDCPSEFLGTASQMQFSRPQTAGTGRGSNLSATHPALGGQPGQLAEALSAQMGRGGSPAAAMQAGTMSAGPQAKFMGLSSYCVEYPDWGGSKPYHMKRIHEAVPTKDMKFEGQSQYRENFLPAESLAGLAAKQRGRNAHSTLSLHGAGVKLDGKTTTQETFQPFPKGLQKTISCKKFDRILSAHTIPGMYTTEYKDKYIKQKRLMKNPQDVRKQLAAQAQ